MDINWDFKGWEMLFIDNIPKEIFYISIYMELKLDIKIMFIT